MEELGLADSPLGSLSADLASYLNGTSFAGIEQPFLGELEAFPSRLDVPLSLQEPLQDGQPEPSSLQPEELPSTSGAAGVLSNEDDEEADQRPGSTKRRRRTRTERQQVLNRLAQQRYRQRKKEKVQALQSTVGTLQCQLDRLSLLEAENAELRATTSALSTQLAAKDAAIATLQTQLRSSFCLLKQQTDKVSAQERQLAENAATLEAQRQQLRSSSLAGLDPQALSDRLLGIIKDALAGAEGGGAAGAAAPASGGSAAAGSQQQPGHAAAAAAAAQQLLSEEVVSRISRTLTSCCRELVYATKGKQVPQAEAPSAIPVSCC